VLREYLDQLKTELRLRFAAGHERRILLPIAQKAQMSLDEVQRVLAEAGAAARKPKTVAPRIGCAHSQTGPPAPGRPGFAFACLGARRRRVLQSQRTNASRDPSIFNLQFAIFNLQELDPARRSGL